MEAITIRGLEDGTKKRLRSRAAANGRSMEAELREIVKKELAPKYETGAELLKAIRDIVKPLGGFDDVKPFPRQSGHRPPPRFD